MSVDIDALGAGSIVETEDGLLYTKDRWGDWWKLTIAMGSSPIKGLNAVKAGKVIRETEKNPLDKFQEGDIITINGGTVAVRVMGGYWEVAGIEDDFTSEALLSSVWDVRTIRKVGEAHVR